MTVWQSSRRFTTAASVPDDAAPLPPPLAPRVPLLETERLVRPAVLTVEVLMNGVGPLSPAGYLQNPFLWGLEYAVFGKESTPARRVPLPNVGTRLSLLGLGVQLWLVRTQMAYAPVDYDATISAAAYLGGPQTVPCAGLDSLNVDGVSLDRDVVPIPPFATAAHIRSNGLDDLEFSFFNGAEGWPTSATAVSGPFQIVNDVVPIPARANVLEFSPAGATGRADVRWVFQ